MKKWRLVCVIVLLLAASSGIFWRLLDLCIFKRNFLLEQSRARISRSVSLVETRGIITDRLGSPLAISIPVASIWVNPKQFTPTHEHIKFLATWLNISETRIYQNRKNFSKRSFVYLKRAVSPSIAKKIRALHIPGLFFQQEYRRYYPEGSVAAQVIGFTNVDDHGQEGLELVLDSWLSGQSGTQKVITDRMGHIISEIKKTTESVQGQHIVLSLNHHIQYAAYQALKEAVDTLHAQSGSVVVLDAQTGEVLAMVNQPDYNPNQRTHTPLSHYRNRAVTDALEPGSVIKPFTVALALSSGIYTPNTLIDTHSGRMSIGGYHLTDYSNYGVVTLTGLLQKSSDIAAIKILLSLPAKNYWKLLYDFGFGNKTDSGFPGEASGHITPQERWVPSVIATISYGYGLSVTALQLASAYATLATGVKHPVTFLKVENASAVPSRVILSPKVSQELGVMMETVLRNGTGTRARIPYYTAAGKTGTAYLVNGRGYDKTRYLSSFAGFAPVRHPKIVVVVMIKDPKGKHLGGLVAAPVFAQVMEHALHWLNIPPECSSAVCFTDSTQTSVASSTINTHKVIGH